MSTDNWKEEFITSEFGPLLKRTNTKTGEVQLFSPSGKQVGNSFFIPVQKDENSELERARHRAMEQVNQYPQEDAFVKYAKDSLEDAQTLERIDNLMRLLSQHFTTKAVNTATTSKSQKEASDMWDEVRKRYETDEIFRKKIDRVAKEWRALRGNRSSLESYVEVVLRNYEVSKSISGTFFARSDDEILQGLLDSVKEETVQKSFHRATSLQREIKEGSYDMNNIARFLEETYGLKRPPFTPSDLERFNKEEVGRITRAEHFHPRVPITDDDGGIYSFPTKLSFPLYGLVTVGGQPVGEVREQIVSGIPVPILQSEAFLPQSIEQVFCGLCHRPIELEVIPLYHHRQGGLIPVCCLQEPRTLLEIAFSCQRSNWSLRVADGTFFHRGEKSCSL